jgi:hypothetical protein
MIRQKNSTWINGVFPGLLIKLYTELIFSFYFICSFLLRHLCKLILISIVFICIKSSSAQPITQKINFDFGPAADLENNYTVVGKNDGYHEDLGYGLLSPADRDFSRPAALKDSNNLIYDGIVSESEIRFRVNLQPGEYWIELYLPGGKFNSWSGQIKVNGVLITDSLQTIKSTFEAENPPLYWTIFKKVKTDQPYLIFEIQAENQPSALSALSVFPDNLGPIQLNQGKLIPVEVLRSPNACLALRLINEGKIEEAQRIIDPIPEDKFKFEKALLLMALAGRLECKNPRPVLEWSTRLLRECTRDRQIPAAGLHLKLIELYIEADQWYKMAGWDWAKRLTGQGIFDRIDRAGFALQKITEVQNHPLYHQSLFYLGKITYWNWVEQHRPYMLNIAKACFAELHPYYPENQLLQLYRGERTLPSLASTPESSDVPLWAYYATEALKHTISIIHYWVDIRQAENGEFGGKYDDDVEMLRWWPIARLAVNDQKTLTGMQRLVDGIWHSDWIVNGFSAKVLDVEHAAEPVADTQPMMIGLDYGNPVYVERCMESIKGLNDLWTGINSKGHRHFKSSWYSSTAIDTRPPRDCDLPMNTRTVKAARWLAWYNRHPVAMKFLREWADAWLEDCLRTDKGKPYGIVPAAVRYEDDAIGGHADNWYAPGMFWDYFNFNGGTQMLQQFLVTYDLTGDKRYLQPVELAVKLVSRYNGKILENSAPGTEEWVVSILRKSAGFAQTIEKYRLLTENKEFDDLLVEYGSDYLKFRLKNDLAFIEKGHRRILDGISHNGELITSEGYFTDRIEIGNIHKSQSWGTSHLESCYTGTALSEGFYPFYSVSWMGMNEKFAALITESTEKSLVVRAHNLDEQPQQGEICFWRLEPGRYFVEQSTDTNEDGLSDEIIRREEIEILKKPFSWPLSLPGKKSRIVTVRQEKALRIPENAELADLALIKSEVLVSGTGENEMKVKISLHNIGIKEATDFDVSLSVLEDDKTRLIARKKIERLEAPLDLVAKIMDIEFVLNKTTQLKGDLLITADPADNVEEITEGNNQITVSLTGVPGQF